MKERFEHVESPFATETIGAQRAQEYGPRMAALLEESPFARRLGSGYPLEATYLPQDEDELEDAATSCCGAGAHELEEEDFESLLAQEEVWADTSEQIAFRDRVLAAHIARNKDARGAAQRDLSPGEIKTVPGTSVKMLPDAAAAAGRLLAAANVDLAVAQQAGDADALNTQHLSATSGYRGSDHQRRLWLQYFSAKHGYYDRTQAAREAIAEGPHSEQAAAYMLKRKSAGGFGLGGRIAAPGYSNHQGGIAIDFWQERRKGHGVANKSDDASRARWRASWFHHWLKDHAALHGFKPIPTEEWHWEYRPRGDHSRSTSSGVPVNAPSRTPADAASGQITDHLGGKLWSFNAAALPLRVAVFCPPAALSGGQVDVLLFAHGLLNGCPRPKRIPEGFVTDAPFRLGRIVAASGRPVVLVVPLMDWARPGGERAFGAGHERWHALARPQIFNAVIDEVLGQVARARTGNPPSIDKLIIAGHSRAYDFLEPLASRRADPQIKQGALARLSEVWALDTTYGGQVERWLDWLNRDPRLQLTMFYRPASGTAAIGDAFYRRRGERLKVIRVNEGHCEVPATRLPALLGPPVVAEHETGYETQDAYVEPPFPGQSGEAAALADEAFASFNSGENESGSEWLTGADSDAEGPVASMELEADLSATHGLDREESATEEISGDSENSWLDESSDPSALFASDDRPAYPLPDSPRSGAA